MKKFICIVIMILLLTACGNVADVDTSKQKDDSKPEVTDTKDENPDINVSVDNEGVKGYIIANKVKIRESGSLESSEIDTLKIGTVIEILDKSSEKQKIGDFENYWYKVKANDKIGWCFGEFVSNNDDLQEKIKTRCNNYFSSENLTIKDAVNTVSAYINFTKDIDLIDNAVKKVRKLQEDLICNYEGELWKFADTIRNNYYDVYILNEPEKVNEKQLKDILLKIKENGYSIYYEEGEAYIEINPQYLLDNFKNGMSDKLKEFLQLQTVEVNKHVFSDAAIVISRDELADRIANWAVYIEKYPQDKEVQEIKKKYHDIYLFVYLTGMPNTPIYDWNTQVVTDEVKRSYERFIEKYEGSSDCEVVKKYYKILKNNDFKNSPEAEKFLEAMNPWENQ